MNAVIKMDVASENLTPEELADITGFEYPSKQIEWLEQNGYPYEVTVKNGKKVVRVGRWYYRLRLAGVKVGQVEPSGANKPHIVGVDSPNWDGLNAPTKKKTS